MIGETEAISAVGSMFWGIGGMVIMLVIAYLVYQVTRIWKGVADMNERYDVMEEISLDKYAKKKGINLEKEIMKRHVFSAKKKNFRRKLTEELFDDFFGKEKEKQE